MRLLCLVVTFMATMAATTIACADDYPVGTVRSFYQIDATKLASDPDHAFYQADFTCVRRGEHGYVFVQNNLPATAAPTDEYVERVFQHFERMSTRVTDLYGPTTDVDQNGRFIILLAQIRDWTFYGDDASAQPPIQGYLWPDFVTMNGNDYLTMSSNAPGVDALGTLIHEFTHNIYDAANPTPAKAQDRGVTEAIANYAIEINGTLGEDTYFAYEREILREDVLAGTLLNAFDGTVNYFDPTLREFHHCYAAGYYFMKFLMDTELQSPTLSTRPEAREFLRSLIEENPNASSLVKMEHTLRRFGILATDRSFTDFYNTEFRQYLTSLLSHPIP